jgi:hypothetical protein
MGNVDFGLANTLPSRIFEATEDQVLSNAIVSKTKLVAIPQRCQNVSPLPCDYLYELY